MDNVNDFDCLHTENKMKFPISEDNLFYNTYKEKDDVGWNFVLTNLDVLKFGAETLTKKR